MTDAEILMQAGVLEQPAFKLFRQWHAENKVPLVVFFGSGLSKPAGLPDWKALRSLVDEIADQKVTSVGKIGSDLFGYQPKIHSARNSNDPWVAFKLYKEILGEATFVSYIRQFLTAKNEHKVPVEYRKILELKPRGILTLNLDNLIGSALSEARPEASPTPVYGKDIGSRWEIIQHSDPFLVYLHGFIQDSGSWILTHDDLQEILLNPSHRAFLQYIFLNFRVLFYGISAEDIAVSGRLIELRNSGFKPGYLFWLTNRQDAALAAWADQNWVRIISYKSDPSHFSVLNSFVNICNSSRPDSITPPIVISDALSSDVEEVSPSVLALQHPEKIREYLGAYLKNSLKDTEDEAQYTILNSIIKKYARAIHNSFYISSDTGDDIWFGNKLIFPSLGEGTFGHVYQSEDSAGDIRAIKIIREAVHNKPDMLGGFRRGVRSMKIISEANVSGMVKIIDAYELPPTIVMEMISGSDIDSIIANGHKFDWQTKLTIILKTAKIVRSAHLLADTVIHRDLKPTNIMVKDFDYTEMLDPEIVVLDFDMSWHKGSKEKDVIFEARDDFAYLAPEQVDPNIIHMSTSTLVDSYGLGMTAYYLFSETHPQTNAYLNADWFNLLRAAASKSYTGKWASAPNRLARLIMRCTLEDQKQRMDFGQIIAEIYSIERSVTNYKNITNPEILAEELIANISNVQTYDWDYIRGFGQITTSRGVIIRVSADKGKNKIIFDITWQNIGVINRSNIAKYLSDAIAKCLSSVGNSPWRSIRNEIGQSEARFSAEILVEEAKVEWKKTIESALKFSKSFDFA